MKTRISILCTALCILVGACSSSSQVGKGKQKVDNFTHISSSSGIDVYFAQGDKHTVKIEADGDMSDKVLIGVENGCLKLSLKKNISSVNFSTIKAYVTAKTLEGISVSGGANFYADNIKTNKGFSVAASGAADVEIIKLKTDDCKIAISGGSDCDISDLNTKYLEIAASGGSDTNIKINDAEDIKVAARGGADVTLIGKTKRISISCSGGADADIRDLSYDKIDSSKSGGGRISK